MKVSLGAQFDRASFPRRAMMLALALAPACDPTIHLGAEALLDGSSLPAEDARANDGALGNVETAPASDAVADAAENDDAGAVDGQATIVWSASFESGTLSDWDSDGLGGTYSSMNTMQVVTTERAHTGLYSAKLTINPMSGIVEDLYLFRGGAGAPAAPREAYYGVWIFIPQPYIESFYWNIFHFLQSATADRQGLTAIWDINLRSNDAGDLVPYVYDFVARRQRDEPTPTPVPIERWFHLEVLLGVASDATGRMAIWQDGVRVFDVQAIVTSATPWIEWAIGSTSTDIMPAPADLFIDDVTLSSTRVGP